MIPPFALTAPHYLFICPICGSRGLCADGRDGSLILAIHVDHCHPEVPHPMRHRLEMLMEFHRN